VLPLLFHTLRWTGYEQTAVINKKQKAALRKMAESLPLLAASPLAAHVRVLQLAGWRAGHNHGHVHTANEAMWDAIGRLPALRAVECVGVSLRADYLHRLDRPTLRRLALRECAFPWVDGLALPALEELDLKELDGSERAVTYGNFRSDGPEPDTHQYDGTAAAHAFVDGAAVLLRPAQLRTLTLETASSLSLSLFVTRVAAELPVFAKLRTLEVLVHAEEDDVGPLLARCPELESLIVRGPSDFDGTCINAFPKRLRFFNGRLVSSLGTASNTTEDV
jgi:hypothetical protein